MRIIYGLKDGAVLQRDENVSCTCIFSAESFGEIRSSLGKITKLDENLYRLSGIRAGGPYSLILEDERSRIQLKDLYVGDVWLLAGQSNMEGAGKLRKEQLEYDANPIPSVRAYYMRENWAVAKTQLHQLWESADPWIRDLYRSNRLNSPWKTEYPDVQIDGVGPGIYFGIEMYRRTNGIPQGLIPCGIGGSSLQQWNPNGINNFYTSMVRRVRECGGIIKGVFWHQGESQTSQECCESFVQDMEELLQAIRKEFHNPDLPFVQVQLHKYNGAEKKSDIWWTRIRELQRTLDQKINNLGTVYTVDLELDDLIHLSSESQQTLGKRAAEAMDHLVAGEKAPSPQFDRIEIVTDDYVPFRVNLLVYYHNIVGGLHALGVPSGYSILDSMEGEPIREIVRLQLEKNYVRVKVEIPPNEIGNYYLCYGFGNTYYCNLTDGAGRSLPAMGPIKISDYINGQIPTLCFPKI